jgi:hypothetical protein
MNAILLLGLVPALIIATAVYAVLAELRHNSVRRSRWEDRPAADLRERPAVAAPEPAGQS